MSRKWIRSKAWDDRHIPGWAWPIKAVLRAFSSIWLAVVLLLLVSIYGVLASVPIGLLALIPTKLLYALTWLVTVGVLALAPTAGFVLALQRRGASRAIRFTTGVLGVIVLGAGASWLWGSAVWPRLRYEELTGEGVRLFSAFVERYEATTLRRLPGFEMTETEFYAWWPLTAVLLAFVANMVTATLRRIEFTFQNLGVLTVHTGIVVIALGSAYYQRLKVEGDVLLLSGSPDESGRPTAGAVETGFYDRVKVALWASQGEGWEQRLLDGLPRYNDYDLGASGASFGPGAAAFDGGRRLSMPVPRGTSGLVDPELEFRIVGYASYASLEERWIPGEPEAGEARAPVRSVEMISRIPDEATGEVPPGPVAVLDLLPTVPAMRATSVAGGLGVEYLMNADGARWEDLKASIPGGGPFGLIVEVPGANHRSVLALVPGQDAPVGDTGYRVVLDEIHAEPPFPIITSGYENALSSVAVVRVIPPAGPDGAPAEAFQRWVYGRFPEISQDLLPGTLADGRPRRRDADPAISIRFIDGSIPQVHIDERAGEDGSAGPARAIVRLPGRDPVVLDPLPAGGEIPLGPMVGLRLGERHSHARRVEIPVPVPEADRERDSVGNHREAAVAVEVSKGDFRSVVWVPFVQYLHISQGRDRTVRLPDGSSVRLAFSRVRHRFPGMALQLLDFEMTPYPHSDEPRDFRSDLLVLREWKGEYDHARASTSLNYPLLTSPFIWSEQRGWAGNALGATLVRFGPLRFKFSQAGWDADGWRQTTEAARRGELPRPYAAFTILGVGNNPGIYVIALGGIMMSLGIPWAFYVKPWLLRREKKRIQRLIAEGKYPGAKGSSAGSKTSGSAGAGSPEHEGVTA